MKRSTWRWLWTLVATAAVSLLALSFWSNTDTPSRPDVREGADIAQTQGSDGDLLAAGRNVTLREQVSGDLAVAGRAIRLSAPVAGYMLERRDAWRYQAAA